MKVAFVGRAGSGKTTLAKILMKQYGFYRLSFAKRVKDIAQAIMFWRPINKSTDRGFLQLLGDGVRQTTIPDVWVHWLNWEYREKIEEGIDDFVVDDCRYLNEAQWLRDNGFVIIKLIGRAYEMGEKLESHPSEVETDLIEPDYRIDASGTVKAMYTEMVRILDL